MKELKNKSINQYDRYNMFNEYKQNNKQQLQKPKKRFSNALLLLTFLCVLICIRYFFFGWTNTYFLASKPVRRTKNSYIHYSCFRIIGKQSYAEIIISYLCKIRRLLYIKRLTEIFYTILHMYIKILQSILPI